MLLGRVGEELELSAKQFYNLIAVYWHLACFKHLFLSMSQSSSPAVSSTPTGFGHDTPSGELSYIPIEKLISVDDVANAVSSTQLPRRRKTPAVSPSSPTNF